MQGNIRRVCIKRFLNAVACRPHHLGVDAQFLAIVDFQTVGCGIGVEHGRNVVLGVARGKQHAGHGQHALNALGSQAVEAGADDGGGKFEVAIFNRVLRQAPFEMLGEHGEFAHCVQIPAAMAT